MAKNNDKIRAEKRELEQHIRELIVDFGNRNDVLITGLELTNKYEYIGSERRKIIFSSGIRLTVEIE